MQNDRTTSELISRSLAGGLRQDAEEQLESEMADNEEGRNFQRLSQLIQDSVREVVRPDAVETTTGDAGLTQEQARRLKDSIRLARMQHSSIGVTVTGETGPSGGLSGLSSDASDPNKAGDVRRLSGRFTLIRKLGEGGLGSVWLARDELLKRTIALKEMHPGAAETPRAWQRFHREAEITGHLEHPNVVPLYAFGRDPESGQPFYAMRFVGKRTLVTAIEEYHDRLAAGEDVSINRHKLLTAFLGVCNAIAYAHSRGVIHRDLKPENVALDRFGQVVVLDWGLAKVNSDFDSESLLSGDGLLSDSHFEKTMAGEVVGTPLYMAPEQAAGNQDDVDERTDIYGLGAILFAMLTGKPPHHEASRDGDGPVGIRRLLDHIRTSDAPRPTDYREDIPSDLEAICRKAMNTKPHLRYQAASDLGDAVQMWMAGRSELRQSYANMRSEGRELRAGMMSSIRDLERNVRFMAGLPPIDQMIAGLKKRADVDMSAWRERLAAIFRGLLQTNTDFSAVTFLAVEETEYRELVRVERHSKELSAVRILPSSRLGQGPMTDCMRSIAQQNPEEVHVTLASECPSGSSGADQLEPTHLAAGTPIFDPETEELFGVVMIETELDRLVESLAVNRLRATERVFVLNNRCEVLIDLRRDGTRDRSTEHNKMPSVLKCWPRVLPTLKSTGEFIDDRNHAVYASRADLVPGKYSLAVVLLARDPDAAT